MNWRDEYPSVIGWWVLLVFISFFAAYLNWFGLWLMGLLAVVMLFKQQAFIIKLLKEQNELLRQKNEKQE